MEPICVLHDEVKAWLAWEEQSSACVLNGLDAIMRSLARRKPEEFYWLADQFGQRFPPKSSMTVEKRRYLFRLRLQELRDERKNDSPGTRGVA